MKTTALLIAALMVAGSSVLACDKDKAAKATKPEKKTKSAVVEKRVITGSYIPQEVNRSGQITDTPYVVRVIDQKAIRNSGASDVRDLLIRRGNFR